MGKEEPDKKPMTLEAVVQEMADKVDFLFNAISVLSLSQKRLQEDMKEVINVFENMEKTLENWEEDKKDEKQD